MIEKANMTAWERLSNPLTTERSSKYRFSVHYMPHLLKKLEQLYPSHGFSNIARNTENAGTLQKHICRTYLEYQVNAAHAECIKDMQAGFTGARRNKGKPRMNFQNNRVEDDIEDALGMDDTPRDQAWLDNEVKQIEDKPAPKQDNTQLGDAYLTKVEFGRHHAEIKHNFNEVGNSFALIRAAVTGHTERFNDVEQRIDAIVQSRPTIIELKKPELPETIKLGVQHKQFPHLLAMAHARENVWVYGPAGTGKSTAGEMLAVALFNNKDKFFTNGKMENQFEVLGYRNAAGVYQTTQFREAYEHGGVYMADEIDGSMPSAVLALNGALANGHCPFPDKTVARHPDFIFIGAANTTGMGGTIEYVGRMKHDAAFLDRFVTLDWPLDEGLEDALVPNKRWLAYVRVARNRLDKNPIKGHLITPRASIKGANLLAYGVDPAIVIKATLQKGLSDTQWRQIEPAMDKVFS